MKLIESRPSQFLREPFGGCDCSLGRTTCDCAQACEQAEPEETTEEAHPWLWWVYFAAFLGTIGVSAFVR